VFSDTKPPIEIDELFAKTRQANAILTRDGLMIPVEVQHR
jgi:hypothetical protein